jgi:hypothetical protein
MLAYIPQNMSRKRSVPFRATITTDRNEEAPMPKRTRTSTAGVSSGYRGNNGGEGHHSLDVFVLPQAPKSRRVASLKAQVANTSLLLAETRHRSRSSSPHEFSSAGEEEGFGGLLVAEGPWGNTSVVSERPQERVTSQESGKPEQAESCASPLSPLSSLGSEWEEEKTMGSGDALLKVNATPKFKTPVLNLVPVVEKTQSSGKQKQSKPPGPSKKPPAYPPIQGYVRRMASLNARAFVSAMMETGRQPYRRKESPANTMISTPSRKATGRATDTIISSEIPSVQPTESVSGAQNRASTTEEEPEALSDSLERFSKQCTSDKEATPEDPNFLSPFLGKGPGYVLLCASPNTLTQCGIIRGGSCDASTFNTEGLLWNGDTVHPQARVYLTPEGAMPRLIVPPVCPARPHRVSETKDRAQRLQLKRLKKTKAVKGDNGWYALGDPIKEVVLTHKEGTRVSRKYYAGIRRKNEELWVRDCITVRSGKKKKDRPYIAKIGSIWRENSGELRNQQGFQFLLAIGKFSSMFNDRYIYTSKFV